MHSSSPFFTLVFLRYELNVAACSLLYGCPFSPEKSFGEAIFGSFTISLNLFLSVTSVMPATLDNFVCVAFLQHIMLER